MWRLSAVRGWSGRVRTLGIWMDKCLVKVLPGLVEFKGLTLLQCSE
jgi:hypothetical protein